MRILLFGASRNIGYAAAKRLLAQGHTCTFLLRRPEAMESGASMAAYIKEGKAKLVHGDGLVEADVQRAWDTAKSDGEVDIVIYSIGAEGSLSLLKGVVITPHDITARGMAVLLSVIQSSTTPATRPKLVTVTVNASEPRTYSLLPILIKFLYSWVIRMPVADKAEQEKNIKRATGQDGSGQGWMPAENVTIVRPAILTDGECVGDKKADGYRTGDELPNVWTISRADVAHFIAEKVLTDWGKWGGKAWAIGY
ncbi:NAD(P)H-binding family protein [Ceratobasidium sp. AG-Ba]|nr:NAD(P)H-binding family protein [Ceratobasidium sp. AG-Ba]QRW09288.1 NAD(P)H-binding family protein [Ceratobasidium sp. AG-Ba]